MPLGIDDVTFRDASNDRRIELRRLWFYIDRLRRTAGRLWPVAGKGADSRLGHRRDRPQSLRVRPVRHVARIFRRRLRIEEVRANGLARLLGLLCFPK